jgi:hypothetical protein
MAASTHTAKRAAREAEESRPVKGLARLGFAGRGIVYVVVGLLALRVAWGGGARADRDGALATIKGEPLGGGLLVLLALSFAGYACWRLLEGVAGHRDEDDRRKRFAERVGSLGRGALYVFLFGNTVLLLTSGEQRDKTKPLTARAMEVPGGRVVVGLVGAAIVGGGLRMAYRGVTEKALDRLDLRAASHALRRAAAAVALVGLVGRGVVVCLLGGFLLQAAVTFDPHKAKGVDATLKTVADAPLGPLLLTAAAVGLLAFGAWSFLEARYRKV